MENRTLIPKWIRIFEELYEEEVKKKLKEVKNEQE